MSQKKITDILQILIFYLEVLRLRSVDLCAKIIFNLFFLKYFSIQSKKLKYCSLILINTVLMNLIKIVSINTILTLTLENRLNQYDFYYSHENGLDNYDFGFSS